MSKASYLKVGSKNLIIQLDRLFYQSNIVVSIEFHALVKWKFVLQKMNALGDILCTFFVLSLEKTTRISLYGFVIRFFVERFAVQINIWSFICAERDLWNKWCCKYFETLGISSLNTLRREFMVSLFVVFVNHQYTSVFTPMIEYKTSSLPDSMPISKLEQCFDKFENGKTRNDKNMNEITNDREGLWVWMKL